jgi:4-hydroxy-tetrahydrodipicolinate synthase
MSQAAEPRFGRMIPAMITPFDKNLEVDLKQARSLARRLIDGGSDALLVCGTTGEGPTICADAKLDLFSAVAAEADGRIPVIANIGSNCTADSIAFGRKAVECGIDGIMAVVPYYNKPPQEGMYRHFRAIAEAVDLPMVLYNIPGRCGANMEADTTLRLARDCSNIVAVKEASGDLDQVRQLVEGAPRGFAVYSGDDAKTYDIMKLGGAGVVSTIANVLPGGMKKIVELCSAKDWDAAWTVHEKLQPLMHQLFVTSNPILVKEALNLMGVNAGGVRLPLVAATPEQSHDLAQVMRQVGALS